MNELALFAGAGGGILGGKLLGWRTVCAVEIDEYAREVLKARQEDGCLKPFPVWDDVRTFDGKPWRGIVDVVSGGFPCQDISVAGTGKGLAGERSGLWREYTRILGDVRPLYVFVENSPILTSRGLGVVLGDLAALGYDAEWGVLSAADAIFASSDPPFYHLRERIWITAYSRDSKRRSICGTRDTEGAQLLPQRKKSADAFKTGSAAIADSFKENGWWTTEPGVDRMVYGLANRVDRERAIGNGQVPSVARLAWEILMQ